MTPCPLSCDDTQTVQWHHALSHVMTPRLSNDTMSSVMWWHPDCPMTPCPQSCDDTQTVQWHHALSHVMTPRLSNDTMPSVMWWHPDCPMTPCPQSCDDTQTVQWHHALSHVMTIRLAPAACPEPCRAAVKCGETFLVSDTLVPDFLFSQTYTWLTPIKSRLTQSLTKTLFQSCKKDALLCRRKQPESLNHFQENKTIVLSDWRTQTVSLEFEIILSISPRQPHLPSNMWNSY